LSNHDIDARIAVCLRTLLSEQQQTRVYAVNSDFYPRLTAYPDPPYTSKNAGAPRRTDSARLFSRDYVLIPVDDSPDWSLAVVVRPCALLVSARDPCCCIHRSLSPFITA
jgi:Ulp1 family protease